MVWVHYHGCNEPATQNLSREAGVRVTWFATLGQDWCEVWRPERREFLQHRIHRLVGFDG